MLQYVYFVSTFTIKAAVSSDMYWHERLVHHHLRPTALIENWQCDDHLDGGMDNITSSLQFPSFNYSSTPDMA